MSKARKPYSEAENNILFHEANSLCPLCGKSLCKMKGSVVIKSYEIAHIYPLNPTLLQDAVLKDELPPKDINSLGNVIALCHKCHRDYDKFLLLDEYKELKSIKQNISRNAKRLSKIGDYTIDIEIYEIIDSIANDIFEDKETTILIYDPVTVENKIGIKMPPVKKRKINRDVSDYYQHIKSYLKALEQSDQDTVNLIQIQIRAFYLAMKKELPDSYEEIFQSVVIWLKSKSNKSEDACSVLAAFFVQNCEIFDADAK